MYVDDIIKANLCLQNGPRLVVHDNQHVKSPLGPECTKQLWSYSSYLCQIRLSIQVRSSVLLTTFQAQQLTEFVF